MLSITKPGIVAGNAVTTAGGFAIASQGSFDPILLATTLFGLSFLIISAAIFNNIIDRFRDRKMARTQERPLARGQMGLKTALVMGLICFAIGLGAVIVFTNPVTVVLSLTGFVLYTILYAIFKRLTVYGTLIGSLSGAIPPVVGYTAVSHHVDGGAFLLFLLLILWQMVHFYAIAIYRAEEYRAASFPVFPNERGIDRTMKHMSVYIIAFTIVVWLLVWWPIAVFSGGGWLALSLQGFVTNDKEGWARNMFFVSLAILPTIFLSCLLT